MPAPRLRVNPDGSRTWFGADPTMAGGGDLFSINQAGNTMSLLGPNAFASVPRNYLTASKETITDPRWLTGDFAGLNLPAPAAWFDTSQAHPEYVRQMVQSGDADGGWNEALFQAGLGDFVQTGTRRNTSTGGPESEALTDGAAGNYIRPVWRSPDQLRYVEDVYGPDGKFLYRDLMDDHGKQRLENAVVDAYFSFMGAGWAQGLDNAVQAEDRGDESGIYKGLLQAYAGSGAPGSNYAGAINGAWNAYDAAKNDDWAGAAYSAYNAYNTANSDPKGSRWKTGTIGGDLGTTGVDDFRQGEIGSYETDGSLTGAAVVGGNQGSVGGWSGGSQGNQDTGGSTMWGTGFDEGLTNDWDASNLNDSQQISLADYGMDDFLKDYGGNDQSWWDDLMSGKNVGLLGKALSIYNGLGGNKTLGGLLGAYLGYQDAKGGKNATAKVEPWAPMQPYLMGLADHGADLYRGYVQQPFSPAEQTAYRNFGNVIDYANGNAGGLMSGFDATARGQNQFVRGQPRSLIGNSYDANNPQVPWRPGLLSNFGTKG